MNAKAQKAVQTKLAKGLLDMIILEQLEKGSMHGYQLITTIRKSFGVYFGPSTIYPLLTQLEKKGNLQSVWNMNGDRPRKEYKLNAPYAPPFPEAVIPQTLDPTPYYQGKVILPTPTESTWKDTIQMNPGEVTTIRVRFTAQDGSGFPFDPTTGPGYVWHCHIIDHEDNEMMRPLIIK